MNEEQSSTKRKPGRPPIGAISQRAQAKAMHLSLRGLQRAIQVRRYGIPELTDALMRDELTLGAAIELTKLEPEIQRQVIAAGIDKARIFATAIRRAQTDPLAVVKRAWKGATTQQRHSILDWIVSDEAQADSTPIDAELNEVRASEQRRAMEIALEEENSPR